jgi:hypothetical protein
MKCLRVVSELINILTCLTKGKIKLYFVNRHMLRSARYLLNGYLCPLALLQRSILNLAFTSTKYAMAYAVHDKKQECSKSRYYLSECLDSYA